MSVSQKRECVISPNNSYKVKWDVWIILVLIVVAITLPYNIGFIDKPNIGWQIVNYVVDFSFLTDMVLTFFTAIPNPSTQQLITNKKLIAKSYISGWFWIDLISIVPFDLIVKNSGGGPMKGMAMAKMGRLTRLSKFIRLIRILRMTKMFRFCKDRQRISDRTENVVQLDANVSRMLMFFAGIMVINHILTCMWVFASKFN